MKLSVARRAALGLVMVVACLCIQAQGTDYRVRMIMPVTGAEALPAQTVAQQQQLATLAAQEVTAAWNDGDNLIVDFVDTKSSDLMGVQLALQAANDPSVIAVTTVGIDTDDVHELSRLLDFFNITMLNIDTVELDSDNLNAPNFFSMMPYHFDSASIISSLMDYFHWDRVSILHDTSFIQVLQLLEARPDLTITPFQFTDDPTDAFKFLISAGASVNLVLTENVTLASQYLNAAQTLHSMYDKGNAWIVVGPDVDELPSLPSFPAGTLFVETLEIAPSNKTLFETITNSLPGAPWEIINHSARTYDSIKILGQQIKANKPSATRLAVLNSMPTMKYYGIEGLIEFDLNHFRTGVYAVMLNSLPASYSPNVTSVLNWDGFTITPNGTNPTIFPSLTTEVPISDVETYNIAWMLQVAQYYGLSQDALTNFIHYASDAVNSNINVTYEIPKMPAGHRLRVSTLDLGLTATTAIPAALPASSFGTLGILTDCDSTLTALLQNVLSPFGIVQISAAATSPTLSDRTAYPTFLRNVPPDNYQGRSIIDLAKHYGWTELAVVYTNDGYGAGIFQIVQDAAFSEGISITNIASIDPSASDYTSPLSSFTKAQPRVVLLLVSLEAFGGVMNAFTALDFHPKAIVGSDAITFAFSDPASFGITAGDMNGIIATAPSGGYGPKFEAFKTEMAAMPATAPVRVYYDLADAYAVLVLDTVFNYADAMVRVINAGQSPRNLTALLDAMLSTDATFLTGLTKYSDSDRLGAYDLINVVNGVSMTIGRLSTDGVQVDQAAVFPDGTTVVPLSSLPRTQKWLAWRDPAGVVFAVLAILGIIMSVIFFIVLLVQRNSPVVRVATWQFLLVMLFGAALGYGSILTWIGKPHPYICALRIWLPPMAFILIMAPLLTKTWRLHKIFTLTDLKVQAIPLWRLIIMCVAMGIIQLVICIFWIAMGTIEPKITNDPNDVTGAYVSCGANKANRIASYVTYGYLGFLMVVGCYLTFRTRKLPKDFNESRWIGFSIYNTLLFSVIILILGYALKNFPVTVLILICVCTFAISTGAISFMLAPKLWTLLFHPEKRSSSSNSSIKPVIVTRRHDYSKTPKISKETKSYSRSHSKEESKDSRVPTDEL